MVCHGGNAHMNAANVEARTRVRCSRRGARWADSAHTMGKRTILITGARSGFGRALTQEFERRGDRVIGTTRSVEQAVALEQDAERRGMGTRYLPLELESPTSIAALIQSLEAIGDVDVLIQNAGFGVFGPIESLDDPGMHRQFAVNLFGPLSLARRLLPQLRRQQGRIIWIGSIAGRVALPFQAHYSASKAAVASMSDALRMELWPLGVRVSCVEPGDFATGFTGARQIQRDISGIYEARMLCCLANVERDEREGAPPELLAREVARLSEMEDPPARFPVGPNAKLICLLARLLPASWREWAVRRIYDV